MRAQKVGDDATRRIDAAAQLPDPNWKRVGIVAGRELHRLGRPSNLEGADSERRAF